MARQIWSMFDIIGYIILFDVNGLGFNLQRGKVIMFTLLFPSWLAGFRANQSWFPSMHGRLRRK